MRPEPVPARRRDTDVQPEEPMRATWAMSAAVGAAVGLTTPAPTIAVDRAVTPTSASIVPATDSPDMDWWRQSMQTHEQRVQWFREARFGMFIHWGVYSELGGEWKGEPVVGYAEHVMRKCRIPIDVYRKEVAGNFNPTRFDAGAWAQLAKDAGMGYIVIT